MTEISERQAMAAEVISGGCNVWQIFESCRQLIAVCRAVEYEAAPDGAYMGLYRVLGIVDDALEHLEREVRVMTGSTKEDSE